MTLLPSGKAQPELGTREEVSRTMKASLGPENTDVVLLCGGRGSRLGPLTESIPKPLLTVGQKPFLFYLLLRLRRQGFHRFILATHYLSEKFKDFLTIYDEFTPATIVISEKEPLGTGGALRHAATWVRSPCFVTLNGDSFIPQSLLPVLSSHVRLRTSFTMIAARSENVVGGAENKGFLEIGDGGQIIGLSPRAKSQRWVNAGVYILDRDMVLSWPEGRYELETNLMALLGQRKRQVFFSENRLLDIGTPECYAEANQLPGLFALEDIA